MDAPGPADDTSEAARAAHVEVLRRMGPDGRLRAGLRYSADMIRLSRAALRARHPGADEVTLRLLWIQENYGEELARRVAQRLGVDAWPATATSRKR